MKILAATNRTTVSYDIALKNSALEKKALITEVSSGNRRMSVVDSILGAKVRSAGYSRNTNLKQLKAGANLINIAITTLSNLQNQIEVMQAFLSTLNNADPATLEVAEINYQESWRNIFTTLNNTELGDKKLFNGTFAKIPQVKNAAHRLPEHASPFEIQLNNYDQNYNRFSIHIPRLLPGDGSTNNPSVEGTFMPICSSQNGSQQTLEAVSKIPETHINEVSTMRTFVKDEITYYIWDGIDETGSFGRQLKTIHDTIPLGVSKEQDLVHNFCVTQFRSLATYAGYAHSANTENPIRAKEYLDYTKSLAGVIFIFKVKDVITEAASEITSIIQSVGNLQPVKAIQDALTAIPDDQSSSYMLRILRDAALKYYELVKSFRDGTPSVKSAIINRINVTKDFIMGNDISLSESTITGSVLTNRSRRLADHILVHANDTLTHVIASLKSQQKELNQATEIESIALTQYTRAEASYFNTDYSHAIAELTRLLREDKVSTIIFSLSERTINELLRSICDSSSCLY